jgi:hypothetical protein
MAELLSGPILGDKRTGEGRCEKALGLEGLGGKEGGIGGTEGNQGWLGNISPTNPEQGR